MGSPDATAPQGDDKPKRQGRQHALTELNPRKAPRKRALKAKDIEEVERMKAALEMRKAGHTFDRIAAQLGFHDASGASKFVKRALELTIQESADEVRKLELERYDAVLRGLLPLAEEGKAREAEVCIKLFERRAKIEGFDAPERTEMSIKAETRSLNLTLDYKDPAVRQNMDALLALRPAQRPAAIAAQPAAIPVVVEEVPDGGA